MHGALSFVIGSRQEVASNTMLLQFDQSKDVSSIIYIDATNLYGGITIHYPLPLNDFELVEEISLDEKLQIKDERDFGFLVEGD